MHRLHSRAIPNPGTPGPTYQRATTHQDETDLSADDATAVIAVFHPAAGRQAAVVNLSEMRRRNRAALRRVCGEILGRRCPRVLRLSTPMRTAPSERCGRDWS